MNGKKALRKFGDLAKNAPPGAHFEVGQTWDMKDGWRVYLRIGAGVLMLSPKDTRGLLRVFEDMMKRPEWSGMTSDPLAATLAELRPLADEAEQKNRDKIVPPPEAIALMPTAGNA